VQVDTPVWYVERDGELLGVIHLDSADTFGYRMESKNYPDCRVWTRVVFGWAWMATNDIRFSIWKPATPPDVVLVAYLLR
jgi:hypothetical protein